MYTRHNEVNQLFDEVIAKLVKSGKLRFREKQIFRQVLGDTPEMHEEFFRFLHDVSTCPLVVIWWCQEQVNFYRAKEASEVSKTVRDLVKRFSVVK